VIIAEIDNSNCQENIDHINGVFRQTLNLTAGSYNQTISHVLTKVTVNGMTPGSKNVGENAKRFNVELTNEKGGYVQPTCSGTLIKNRYTLETSAKMTGCQCCDQAPTAAIETNIFNRSVERTMYVPPPNWQPQIMAAYVCDFSSQFAFSGGMTSALTMPGLSVTINEPVIGVVAPPVIVGAPVMSVGFGQAPPQVGMTVDFGQPPPPTHMSVNMNSGPGFGNGPNVSMNINMDSNFGSGF
jgi:hypothetical protein